VAINSGKNTVVFGALTYLIAGTLTISSSGITLIGYNTVLLKQACSTGHIISILSTTQKLDITIWGITFNVNSINSGIVAQFVTRLNVLDCTFLTMQYWACTLAMSPRSQLQQWSTLTAQLGAAISTPVT